MIVDHATGVVMVIATLMRIARFALMTVDSVPFSVVMGFASRFWVKVLQIVPWIAPAVKLPVWRFFSV